MANEIQEVAGIEDDEVGVNTVLGLGDGGEEQFRVLIPKLALCLPEGRVGKRDDINVLRLPTPVGRVVDKASVDPLKSLPQASATKGRTEVEKPVQQFLTAGSGTEPQCQVH